MDKSQKHNADLKKIKLQNDTYVNWQHLLNLRGEGVGSYTGLMDSHVSAQPGGRLLEDIVQHKKA